MGWVGVDGRLTGRIFVSFHCFQGWFLDVKKSLLLSFRSPTVGKADVVARRIYPFSVARSATCLSCVFIARRDGSLDGRRSLTSTFSTIHEAITRIITRFAIMGLSRPNPAYAFEL